MKAARRWFRRVERALVGAVFGLVAFVIERRVLRAIKRRGEEAPAMPSRLSEETVSEVER